MDTNEILSEINAEISKLQQARAILTGDSETTAAAVKRGPGRPTKIAATPAKKSVKRVMSEEGLARIRAAQKKRRAAEKKAAK
jgi:hypothetical protein